VKLIDQERTPVIYRDLHRAFPTVVRGEGIYLWDAAGKRYIDGAAGSSSVANIGHGVPEVLEAMIAQATQLAYSPTHAFSTEAIEACARTVVEEFAPAGLERVWFVSGGSEATENAVKIALQYQRDRGKGTKQLVIGRWQSFHGATLASLSYGGNAGRRRKYQGMLSPAEHIWPCYSYRNARGDELEYGLAMADQLDYVLQQVGAENVAAFIAEPIVGATLGAVPATAGYFERIREICDRNDVLFIADEVMTGFGRTGKNFGIEHWDATPDLIACAKGISGGYTPLGAVIVRPEIVGQVRGTGGSFVIGHTAGGNPLSTAVGKAVLDYTVEHRLVDNSEMVGSYFKEQLVELMGAHPIIGDVRGLGLMQGVELVADRETKEPFPVELGVSKRIGDATFERGMVSYPGQGTVDGVRGDHLLYTPPLIITREQIDEMIAILDDSIGTVERELGVAA
jgi:adenosylmethionine-8-amino-7-oxononanoate aminotransferase